MEDKRLDEHTKPHVVIIGGGIAGLAAAFHLRESPVRVTVLEASSRVGGKLLVSNVAGVAVDEGAESLYANRVRTTGLITEVGLGDRIMSAGVTASAIWTRGQIRKQPDRQFMSVPCSIEELATSGILSAEGLERAGQDSELPPIERGGDVSVAELVGRRMGSEVVHRLVDPFLASVFSGSAEHLSFEATLTPLAKTARKHRTLAAAADALVPALREGEPPPPVSVATLDGGFGSLPPVLVDKVLAASPDHRVLTLSPVQQLSRGDAGWRIAYGSTSAPERLDADAVILAVPAGPARDLLRGVPGSADAVTALSEVVYADVAMVTLAYPRSAFLTDLRERGYAGYRVPAIDGRTVKEVAFTTVKWPHMAGDVEILRCSLGRFGEEGLLERDDADLTSASAAEVAEAIGVAGAPIAARVSRWDQALPQYTVGHQDRVTRIRQAVAAQPGLAVCGALYDGVGVGVCMNTARQAAGHVLTWLTTKGASAATVAADAPTAPS